MRLGLTLLLLLLAVPPASARTHPKFTQLVKQAERLYSSGKYKDSAEKLIEAYVYDPHPRIIYNIARAYDQAGELELALEYYQRYVKYLLAAIAICFAVWATPRSILASVSEIKAMGGTLHPALGVLGVMSAKNTAVNILILSTYISFLFYRRTGKRPTVSWAGIGNLVQFLIFFGTTAFVIALGGIGLGAPACGDASNAESAAPEASQSEDALSSTAQRVARLSALLKSRGTLQMPPLGAKNAANLFDTDVRVLHGSDGRRVRP